MFFFQQNRNGELDDDDFDKSEKNHTAKTATKKVFDCCFFKFWCWWSINKLFSRTTFYLCKTLDWMISLFIYLAKAKMDKQKTIILINFDEWMVSIFAVLFYCLFQKNKHYSFRWCFEIFSFANIGWKNGKNIHIFLIFNLRWW